MTKTLGEKITELRKDSKLTQEQIANYLEINRVSLANIENDKRILKKGDKLLLQIANLFEVDEDELLDGTKKEEYKKIKEDDDHKKFKNLILYILTKCGQKPNIGKTVLNKLLYFSDFNYYENKWENISNQDYIKLPRGPVPKDIDDVLTQMEDDKQIEKLETEFKGYKQIRFIPNIRYDLSVFNGLEIEIIDNVIEKLSNMNAKQVSDYSHNDMPYISTKNIGDKIPYQLAHMRSGEYISKSENND
ncbi:type II toxin-antitoxin system antitoxin SocA domain-containing protein [Candidatus Vampirococcus lugosii]|uniref:Helix-turn-helix domain-containing protein n=1 Tax=Candidatus Vampirococcus lugosii TaxID=2789015 RepID=A0ABS5QMS6_9BACT|nr:type II toxin-antitoxin system antitoxin SocA domain-containing protein [Candidatus Vampirococcus lugosii]MBS8122505.1 helix-turn-helix domain-containing protein [Candidatus Vampirococcus lugosii]